MSCSKCGGHWVKVEDHMLVCRQGHRSHPTSIASEELLKYNESLQENEALKGENTLLKRKAARIEYLETKERQMDETILTIRTALDKFEHINKTAGMGSRTLPR